ncbi:hypothetical protein Taro_055965 [Colocasia esculenta]|uniref:mannan endo-1,4-beta-mannosidase n=1 Tax=Colocasia esculenta TaxID=4460 RepID=A0A843XUE6_COLES|nr:hypothetical protein [Colocasia esculenta]
MKAGNGLLCSILGLASCVAFIYMSFGDLGFHAIEPKVRFVERNGSQLFVDGKPFYVNGWNSYWLMDQAVEAHSRHRVRTMLQTGAKMGLTVCRTWAFNDGAYHALQVSLGQFDERVFKALDGVIAEARTHGIRLLLSLANNLQPFGGKTQYVKWAWEEGLGLSSSNDSFFYDPSIRIYFKTYLKDWIEEMAGYVKSLDKKHLLTVGLEGFYGPTSPPEKLSMNPAEWASQLGADFIRNSKIAAIDFASVHIYPDQWFSGKDLDLDEKIKYVSKWVKSHIEDGDKELKKPVMFTEFGLSNKSKNFDHSHRDTVYKAVSDILYESSRKHGSGAGAFVWQLLVGGMEEYNDDFGLVPWERPSLYKMMKEHSCRLAAIRYGQGWARKKSKDMC